MTIIISLLLLASLLPHLTFTAHVNVGIVKGRVVAANSRPYMVSLQKYRKHICGGFLISDEFVLTAAHCREGNESLTAVVGAHDLRNKSSDHIRVKSYIPYPEYTGPPKPIRNDIMLLRLEKKVKLNNKNRLILPKQGQNVGTGTVCSVAGWGRLSTNGTLSDRLMEANMTTRNQTKCQRRWGSVYLASQMICAYGSGGPCDGDSGGPLVCGNTAVGVTSFGDARRCNSPEHPEVYTKISAYIKWIRKEMGNTE